MSPVVFFLFSHAQIMWVRKSGNIPHCRDSVCPCWGPCRLQNSSLWQLEDMIRGTSGATSSGSLMKIVRRWLATMRCWLLCLGGLGASWSLQGLCWWVKILAWLVQLLSGLVRGISALWPCRGFHCGTCECLWATLPVSCTVFMVPPLDYKMFYRLTTSGATIVVSNM